MSTATPELIAPARPESFSIRRCVVFDVEVFPAFWCVGIHWQDDQGKPQTRTITDRAALATTLGRIAAAGRTLVGYNSCHYDAPIVRAILGGFDPYSLSRAIVSGKSWPVSRSSLPPFPCDHIDLAARLQRGPLPPSLKTVAANLGRPVLRELPHPPDSVLDADQQKEVLAYNRVDLEHTWAVLERFAPDLEMMTVLSAELGSDVRSLPESRLAESYYDREYRTQFQTEPPKPQPVAQVVYEPPACVARPRTEAAGKWFDKVTGDPMAIGDRGSVQVPRAAFRIGSLRLTVGAGGLHSEDAPRVHYATKQRDLVAVDVRS